MIITKEILESAKTEKGGYKNGQVKFAQKLTGCKKWKNGLIGSDVSNSDWEHFKKLAALGQSRKEHNRKKKALKVLNALSTQKAGLWQPQKEDIPKIKRKKGNNGKNKERKNNAIKKYDKSFYTTDEWRGLRVRVLEKYKCKCMMCGRSPKSHGVVIHVDHIKPRSRHPELSLDFDNLQLLCEDCNLGKSNKYQTDWRPTNV